MFAALFTTFIQVVLTQDYVWKWIGGSSSANQAGDYSVSGSPSPNVFPGARYAHAGAIHPLTDNYILFGGFSSSMVNDLWVFDFTINQWAWISGSNTEAVGVYETIGTPSATAVPGCRIYSEVDLHPVSGLLYLFGGDGYDRTTSSGRLNDLWTFDFGTKQWTWTSGSDTKNRQGTYGTRGTAAAGNVPGSRFGNSLNVHPTSGRVIIFGGSGYATSTTIGALNDLWSFDPTIKQWTWLSGASSTSQSSVFGTKGVPAPANVPGSRAMFSYTINTQNGSLLIHGGHSKNDLWAFDFNIQQWTWFGGNNLANQAGVYGTKGIPAPNNIPGSRSEHQMVFSSAANSVFLFGAFLPDNTFLNDMWSYDFTSNQWTWLSGASVSNQRGVYGTKGVSSASNVPGSRFAFSLKYSSKSNKCILFGGFGLDSASSQGYLNDFWTFGLPALQTSSVFPTARMSTSVGSSPISNQVSSTLSQASLSLIPTVFSSSIVDVESNIAQSSGTSNSASNPTLQNDDISLSDIFDAITTSQTSRRIRVLEKAATNFSVERQYILLVIGVFITGFTLILTVYCYLKRKQLLRRDHSQSVVKSTNSSILTAASSSSATTSMISTSSSISTKVETNQGISIPGYLQFRYGIDFRINGEIARGGFGIVNLGEPLNVNLQSYGTKIIVKQMLKFQMTEREIQLFYQEVSIMHFLASQKYIAVILGYSNQPYCLLMKYYPEGSLDNWIKSNYTTKTFNLLLHFLFDISRGIGAMHSRDLVHCDLKPQNILIDFDFEEGRPICVLTDFGITQIVSNKNLRVKAFQVVNVRGASIAFAAPEAINRLRKMLDIPESQLYKCDMYAYGIITYEIITRTRAWREKK